MELIKRMHCNVMPWLGWYLIVFLLIELVFILYIYKTNQAKYGLTNPLMAFTPIALAWLPMVFFIIWFSVGAKRLKWEANQRMKQRHRL